MTVWPLRPALSLSSKAAVVPNMLLQSCGKVCMARTEASCRQPWEWTPRNLTVQPQSSLQLTAALIDIRLQRNERPWAGIIQRCCPWIPVTSETFACCSVTQSCSTLCGPVDCSTPGSPVLHHLPKIAQTHVRWVSDAIQPSRPHHPLSPAFNLSQHEGLFQWVGSSHQVAKELELQLQHQSFQWIFKVYFL